MGSECNFKALILSSLVELREASLFNCTICEYDTVEENKEQSIFLDVTASYASIDHIELYLSLTISCIYSHLFAFLAHSQCKINCY